MLTQRLNFHHSKLPQIGAIGYLSPGRNRFNEIIYWNGRKQKYQCIAYPLNDNIAPYSYGIHTAFFKNLASNKVIRVSGFYFDSE